MGDEARELSGIARQGVEAEQRQGFGEIRSGIHAGRGGENGSSSGLQQRDLGGDGSRSASADVPGAALRRHCATSPQGLQNLRAVVQAAREECGPVALARTPAGGESAPRGHGSGVVVLSTGGSHQ